ncbi:MAG TPA: pilus assembly protein TadG-related protein [Aeromicrobium sp.]|nr:pilus assembly protein TadG-related protein [Aeromicrobium sp.]
MQLKLKQFNLRAKERGATVVVAALSMTVLLGMAAISVDYAQGVDQKRRVQNAADAVAVAQAEKCALYKDPVTNTYGAPCNALPLASDSLVADNAGSGVGISMSNPNTTNSTATVTLTKDVSYPLGAALGRDTGTVSATATADWTQVPIAGAPIIPMAIGYCDWLDFRPPNNDPKNTGGKNTYRFDTLGSWTGTKNCTGPWGNTIRTKRQKMVWLTSTIIVTDCSGSMSLGQIYFDFVGQPMPFGWSTTNCQTRFASLSKTAGEANNVILLPLYTENSFWGISTGIQIVGYAPFQITDFRDWLAIFGIPVDMGSRDTCNIPTFDLFYSSLGCGAIEGRFIRTTKPFPGWTYGTSANFDPGSGPTVNWNVISRPADRGAVKVRLTN